MNTRKALILLSLTLCALQPVPVLCQGSFQFWNLDFEQANVSGYSPGDLVPTNSATPGWSAFQYQPFVGIEPAGGIRYDAITLGGAGIVINDANSYTPIQGAFSVILYGGAFQQSSSISQTGLVPAGTRSLLFYGQVSVAPFVVSLGGQDLAVQALQSFPGYTLYGADVSSFAGQVAALTFTETPPSGVGASRFMLDNISFSDQPIPEPGGLGIFVIGALLLARRTHRRPIYARVHLRPQARQGSGVA